MVLLAITAAAAVTTATTIQDTSRTGAGAGPTIAVVGATVVPMDSERVLPNRTVLVRGGRIISVTSADSATLPPGTIVVDGHGRYLLPGLADMHVHIGTGIGGRPDFGDAPLFLANGVTTVLNLSGDTTILAIRARVRDGSLIAPTLYTSGPFVNEPLVNTPDEAEREIRAQAAAGYDAIKFREIVDLKRRAVLTTHGMTREAYRRLLATAHSIPIPIIGHSPNNLGLEAALEERQSLAHAEATLVPSYFWPRQTARFKAQQQLGTGAFAVLGAVVLIGWVGILVLAIRRRGDVGRSMLPAAVLTSVTLGIGLLAAWKLWNPYAIGNESLVRWLTAAGIAIGILAAATAWRAVSVARTSMPFPVKSYSLLAALAGIALAGSALGYWLPLIRRSSESGLTALGKKVAKSGIWVTPTMVVARFIDLSDRPEVKFASARSREWWYPLLRSVTPIRRQNAPRFAAFLHRAVGALHRAGVPLLAGTDALGWAFMVPGYSIHDELAELTASGLTPYEALRTATVEPARFLLMPNEFGMVAAGRRADLLLVDRNPLEDLETLKKPLGVMVRGRWLPAAELDSMIQQVK